MQISSGQKISNNLFELIFQIKILAPKNLKDEQRLNHKKQGRQDSNRYLRPFLTQQQ